MSVLAAKIGAGALTMRPPYGTGGPPVPTPSRIHTVPVAVV